MHFNNCPPDTSAHEQLTFGKIGFRSQHKSTSIRIQVPTPVVEQSTNLFILIYYRRCQLSAKRAWSNEEIWKCSQSLKKCLVQSWTSLKLSAHNPKICLLCTWAELAFLCQCPAYHPSFPFQESFHHLVSKSISIYQNVRDPYVMHTKFARISFIIRVLYVMEDDGVHCDALFFNNRYQICIKIHSCLHSSVKSCGLFDHQLSVLRWRMTLSIRK